jgi:hypothetical protein
MLVISPGDPDKYKLFIPKPWKCVPTNYDTPLITEKHYAGLLVLLSDPLTPTISSIGKQPPYILFKASVHPPHFIYLYFFFLKTILYIMFITCYSDSDYKACLEHSRLFKINFYFPQQPLILVELSPKSHSFIQMIKTPGSRTL